MNKDKPLGRKNYGSIAHLPNSRMGPGDHACHIGQARIATEKTRDKHDEIIVQEKLDGSNVGVARIGDAIFPLGRAGYLAASSPYWQHRLFSNWAYANYDRFMGVLRPGERLVGEWLALAHGTKYKLQHEPFVVFDLMVADQRMPYAELCDRLKGSKFILPALLRIGGPVSVDAIMTQLNYRHWRRYGFHGAQEPVEGAVWRVERDKIVDRSGTRKRVVDFLVKYVRPDKIDGKYLDDEIWNDGLEKYIGELKHERTNPQ